jgi:transposase-like protein
VHQAVRRVVEAVMAEELAALLQAEPYERSPRRAGRRNGSYTRDLVTPAGVLEDLRVPRDRDGQFRTQVFERFARYQDDVVDSIVAMFFSGVSQGKVQRVTVPLLGTAPSASTVSRLAHGLEAESEAWRKRRLQAHYRIAYFDGVYFPIVHGEQADETGLLVVLGVDLAGHKEVLAVEVAGTESSAAWQSVVDELKARGLQQIDLVVSDGDEAAIGVLERSFPAARRQRCLTHKIRNVLAKLPQRVKREVAAALKDIFAQPSREEAHEHLEAFRLRYEQTYPEAVACLLRDIDACLTFYDFARAMWKHIRSTNALEGLFSTIRRRTNQIGAFRNETSCLLIVYAVIQAVKFRRVPV